MSDNNLFVEMLNYEELGDLKDMVGILNEELLKNHRIDRELYTCHRSYSRLVCTPIGGTSEWQ